MLKRKAPPRRTLRAPFTAVLINQRHSEDDTKGEHWTMAFRETMTGACFDLSGFLVTPPAQIRHGWKRSGWALTERQAA